MRSRGDAIGWGGGITAHPLSWLQFDTRYTFLITSEDDHLAFTSPIVLAASSGPPVPTVLPTLHNRDHVLESSLRFALTKFAGLRFYYRYNRSGVDDFHQAGLPTILGRRIYLGHQDGAYEAGFYGVALQVAFGPSR
jgi:putative beta-barrel porin MtrB/PioB